MKKILCLLIAMFTMALSSAPLHAGVGDVINIKFGGSPFYNNGAAINDATQYWNSFSATDQESAASLQYSDFLSSSSATLVYNMTGTTGLDASGTAFPVGGIDTPLMRGFVSTDNVNTGYFTISGLEAGEYDLYVYSQIDKNLTSNLSFSANGVAGSLTNNGSLTSLTENSNWLKRTVYVGDTGVLQINVGANNQVNGFQLRQNTPEPATLLLLGVGGALAAAKLRRKKGLEASSASAA